MICATRADSSDSLDRTSEISPGRSVACCTAASPLPLLVRSHGRARASTDATARTMTTHSNHHDALQRHSGHHIEEPHPAEGGELALVRMEHVFACVRKAQLEHVALTLALDHRVGVFAWFERGPGRKAVEEVSVDVERVDRVELDDVDEIDPNELAQLHTHRVVHKMESDGVDGVDLVVLVEVRIECVLHHHELICLRTPLRRVDDEHAIETLCDVAGERQRVAVIQVQPERAGLELVRELLSDVDQSAADVLADSR